MFCFFGFFLKIFTDATRTPTDLPAAPQSAQVPLPGFSTSLFTRCRLVIWSELIMLEGSALILLLGGRNSRTPAHRAEASFEKCFFISELPDNEAWCSLPAVKPSIPVSGSTATPSLRCRKRAHDPPIYSPVSSYASFHFGPWVYTVTPLLFCIDTT